MKTWAKEFRALWTQKTSMSTSPFRTKLSALGTPGVSLKRPNMLWGLLKNLKMKETSKKPCICFSFITSSKGLGDSSCGLWLFSKLESPSSFSTLTKMKFFAISQFRLGCAFLFCLTASLPRPISSFSGKPSATLSSRFPSSSSSLSTARCTPFPFHSDYNTDSSSALSSGEPVSFLFFRALLRFSTVQTKSMSFTSNSCFLSSFSVFRYSSRFMGISCFPSF